MAGFFLIHMCVYVCTCGYICAHVEAREQLCVPFLRNVIHIFEEVQVQMKTIRGLHRVRVALWRLFLFIPLRGLVLA